MQDIASCCLTGNCIDISIHGPDDNPTAIVYAEEFSDETVTIFE